MAIVGGQTFSDLESTGELPARSDDWSRCESCGDYFIGQDALCGVCYIADPGPDAYKR